MIDPTSNIHPLAVVDASVRIGANTTIWQLASVTGGTVLGADCSVSPFAMLHGPRFGDRCIISGGVMMGPGFEVGDDVFIGPNVTFCNDAFPRAHKIGWDAALLQSGRCVAIKVANGAGIGAGAVLLPGITIGEGAMIAAGAVCGVNVPPNHMFKRDGSIVEINSAWAKKRMRAA